MFLCGYGQNNSKTYMAMQMLRTGKTIVKIKFRELLLPDIRLTQLK